MASWITSLAARWAMAVAATLFAVVIALFKEQLQSLFFKPKFHVAVGTRPPFSVKTQSHVYGIGLDGKKQLLWVWKHLLGKAMGAKRRQSESGISRSLRDEA